MLRNFLYLNTTHLDSYVSSVEDGLRSEVETELASAGDSKLGGDLKIVSGEVSRGGSRSARTKGADTPEARFARLLEAVRGREEELGWIDVVNPDVDLLDVGIGALITGEADFYVPQAIQMLTKSQGGFVTALDQLEALEPFAASLGLDTAGLPNKEERKGVRAFVDAMNADLVTVGEFDSSDRKVAGQLLASHVRSQVDGPARFAGKVSKAWPAEEGRPLLALPGTTLLPRAKRRELERKRPSDPSDDSFLMGPAVMVDVLAIWR